MSRPGRLLLLLALVWIGLGHARSEETRWVLGNQRMELHLQRTGDRVTATALVNRIARRTIPLQEDDFTLNFADHTPLRAEDFAVHTVEREKLPHGQRLRIQLQERRGAGGLAIVYDLRDADSFLRRHLEFAPTAPMALREVEVWSLALPGKCWSQESGPPEYLRRNVWDVDDKHGFGQPVFLEDTFWGLEFPAGYNQYTHGTISLLHHPGRTISGSFTSKTGVLGVAAAGHVATEFQAYINDGRGRPRQPAVQVDYNTWTTLMPATASNCVQLIGEFRRNLWEPYGVGFDSFTPDDGWDEKNSLWAIRTNGFPQGFAPLLAVLRPMNTRLGLWLSPSSGYEHAPWGGRHGYTRNASFPWFLCQSDPRYRRDMEQVVPDLILRNEVGFLKMDGFCASCGTNQHPHHLDGDFAREANVDAFLELIAKMRQANPGVYLDPTSGMWLSPWWLWSIDSAWCDTYDGTAPAIVPSINGFDGATTSRDVLLRHRLAQNPGFDPGAIETLGVYLDPTLAIEPQTFFENWQDNAMMVAGRGNRLLTFYLNPAQFPQPARDWAFLAGMIRWTRHHATTLSHTQMILGDPYEREPYGYAHFLGQQGILTLRNPFIQPRSVRIKLDESSGWRAGDAGKVAYAARIVFPYPQALQPVLHHGDSLSLDLAPYQTLMVQLEPVDPAIPRVVGLRAQEVRRSERQVTWDLYGLPGTTLSVPVAAHSAPSGVRVDEKAISPAQTRRGRVIPVTFSGAKASPVLSGGSLRPESTPAGKIRLSGAATITIPGDARAHLYILCQSPTSAVVSHACRVMLNGREVPMTTIRSPIASKIPASTLHEMPLRPWIYYRVALPEGESQVTVAIESVDETRSLPEIEAGCWLWIERPLAKATLTLEYREDLTSMPGDPLPFPSGLEFARQILTLQPLQRFSPTAKVRTER